MRILRILFLILITTIAGIIIHSCCDGYSYRFIYIITKNVTLSPRTLSVIEASDTVSKNSYGIRVHFIHQKIANTAVFHSGNDLYAAYDCWPIFPMEDSILDIHIVTVNDFNPNKSAGDDITESFLASSYGFKDSVSIDDEISRINEDDMDVAESVDLILNDNSIADGWHQFVVNVLLSDNRMMTDTTDVIKFY